MRIDLVVVDAIETLRALIRGLDNGLTASENFAPEGQPGQVLTSNGPSVPPSYQGAGVIVSEQFAGGTLQGAQATSPLTLLPHTHDALDIVSGVLPEVRVMGRYRFITLLHPRKVRADVALYANPLTENEEVDAGWDALVASPYVIDSTLTVLGRLVVV